MTVRSLAVFCLALTIPPAFAAPAATSLPREIDALREEGKIEEAIGAGRAAVSAAPDDVELRLALAKALAAGARRGQIQAGPSKAARGDGAIRVEVPEGSRLEIGYEAAPFEEALVHLSEGIRRQPQRADLRMLQCFLLTDGARIERAAAALRSAARELPRSESLPEELARFGAERGKRGDAEGAVRLLREVALQFPDHPAVQADYGMSLARLGRREESLSALTRATEAAPKDLSLLRMRATAAMTLRDFRAAEAAYGKAFAVSRNESDRFGEAAAAYGADPERGLGLLEELATAGASATPGLPQLATDFLTAGRSAAPAKAETALARRLREGGQPLLALPLLHRALLRGDADGARDDLAAVYRELGMPVLADQVLSGR